jgi:hypothetical protein
MRPGNLTRFTYLQAMPEGIDALTFSSVATSPQPTESGCGDFARYLDDLESSLTKRGEQGILQPQSILVDIGKTLEAQKHHILDAGYTCMLDRLTRIYTKGLNHSDNPCFANTAVNYAGLVHAVSQKHSAYDYTETIGQLLLYMHQLYRQGEKSWLRIFDHLLNMPDSIRGIQTLKDSHFYGIQEWIEEGVDNLFDLREDQMHLHSEQIASLAELEEQVADISQDLARQAKNRVYPIDWLGRKSTLHDLIRQRDLLIDELEDRQRLVELLDQNMQQFEDKLYATRRAIFIRTV